jgi:hypothetical protein
MYSEVRTVDVGANYRDTGPRMPLFRDSEGEQGTLISKVLTKKSRETRSRFPMDGQYSLPGEVILASGLQVSLPVVLLSDLSGSNN